MKRYQFPLIYVNGYLSNHKIYKYIVHVDKTLFRAFTRRYTICTNMSWYALALLVSISQTHAMTLPDPSNVWCGCSVVINTFSPNLLYMYN